MYIASQARVGEGVGGGWVGILHMHGRYIQSTWGPNKVPRQG